ncbi:hypothetical protein B0I31_106159 [Saccharothrix carnea]|uniref:Uncharacterized protein n=1 Tax=Saccharothrix carnea TaxID=1280637 RepID=A0A2P8I872_SACCR|nr:hypothetical protein [Saccharothrix carnea]PSL54643.1 hypothetical protein B0I31_106159 [Saccharothrix carnea]
MKIDVFNEVQDPRPWQEGHQHARITEALAQARLADELIGELIPGFDK